MMVFDKIMTPAHLVKGRLTWTQRDLDYRPPGVVSETFVTAREAVRRILDGAAVLSCGLAGNARCATVLIPIGK